MWGACIAGIVPVALGACSKTAQPKGAPTGGTPAPATETPAATPAPSGPVVTLSGSIHFEGTPPERKTIKMSADETCHKQHTEPVLTEDVVVGASGGLRNVFVSVAGGLEGRQFAVPATPVVLDQKGCVYHPHVFGVMVNQPLKILNNDPTLHNVHAIPESGPGEFNKGMARAGMELTEKFTRAGNVRFKCDVHP